jgi:hypothetical protein
MCVLCVSAVGIRVDRQTVPPAVVGRRPFGMGTVDHFIQAPGQLPSANLVRVSRQRSRSSRPRTGHTLHLGLGTPPGRWADSDDPGRVTLPSIRLG